MKLQFGRVLCIGADERDDIEGAIVIFSFFVFPSKRVSRLPLRKLHQQLFNVRLTPRRLQRFALLVHRPHRVHARTRWLRRGLDDHLPGEGFASERFLAFINESTVLPHVRVVTCTYEDAHAVPGV
eukprot:30967-Pelagococcus_subviridis.AAC.10